MNEYAIKKLRRKFILISFVSLLSVMLLMGGTIFLFNYFTAVRQIDNTLDYLAANNGKLPQKPDQLWDAATHDSVTVSHDESAFYVFLDWIREVLNTSIDERSEAVFGLRYFAVEISDDGDINPITAHIAEIDEQTAYAYADVAIENGGTYGWIGNYRYKVEKKDGGTVVVFLNSANQIADSRRVGVIVLLLSVVGSILSYIIIRIFSNRAIQPEIRNAENQKHFITNAGNELKTPLAVIRANTELEMMMHGEDEWNRSTMNQVDRMTGLISNLVMIAKAEERTSKEELTDTDISAVVSETADTFKVVATQNGKTLTKDIPENIRMVASEAQIRQLTSLLVDNAIKYCDDGGEIAVSLRQKGKGVRLTVENNYAAGEGQDYSRFFDRFYREDKSHNIDKGGYGIGLSIADSLVQSYRGKIDVTFKDGVIAFTASLKG